MFKHLTLVLVLSAAAWGQQNSCSAKASECKKPVGGSKHYPEQHCTCYTCERGTPSEHILCTSDEKERTRFQAKVQESEKLQWAVATGKTRTLTGCLQIANDANEYNLTTGKGGTWEVKSDGVDLAPHVGHMVTVTGVVSNAKMHGMKEDAKEEAKEHGMDKDAKNHGYMTVKDVKMVSESCKE
ncbi:MAG: hypothetical protein WA672_19010 [Candidatus Angelobacter sp.]